MREAQPGELARPLESRFKRWLSACLSLLLAGLWFALIPAVFGGLALRYLVPHSTSAPGLEGEVANFSRIHAGAFALVLFLLGAALIRYWRAFLPGGRYLSSLPAELVERVPRRRVAACEEAHALLLWLESGAGTRWLASSTPELRASVASDRAALRAAMDTGKWSKVASACATLKELTRRAERGGALKKLSFVAWLGFAALLALGLRATVYRLYDVRGNSMLPSLFAGDLLVGKVLARDQSARALKHGDVIVLRVLVDGTEQEIIKRVIGLPGDKIGMQGEHPVINGWPVPFCAAAAYYDPHDETAAEQGEPGGIVALEFLNGASYLTFQAARPVSFPEYLVKPGEVFVLGDNRTNSRDSRSFDAGQPRGFPFADVRAKVERVLLSHARRGDLDLSPLWRPLGVARYPTASADREGQTAVERCLSARPAQTSPPSPVASPALASGVP